jgi:hypothetical protein
MFHIPNLSLYNDNRLYTKHRHRKLVEENQLGKSLEWKDNIQMDLT